MSVVVCSKLDNESYISYCCCCCYVQKEENFNEFECMFYYMLTTEYPKKYVYWALISPYKFEFVSQIIKQ